MNYVEIFQSNIQSFITGFIDLLPEIAVSTAFLFLTYGLVKGQKYFVPRALNKIGMKSVLVELITTVTSGLLWMIGIIVACGIIFPSITPGKILTALGLGSIAIGFAFKDIFENFMAGVLIILREPFHIGDVIEVDDVSGVVETISIRDTVIIDLDQEKIVIPNAMLFKNKVRVFTAYEKRRASIICGIAYGEDIEKAKRCMEKALKGISTISTDHKVEIKAIEFNSSSIDIQILWFTDSKPSEIRESKDQVITAIKKALDADGIEIPFPYRTLTFKDPLHLQK